nr:probable magnesium transporter NIPA2 [Ipomoea batatas]
MEASVEVGQPRTGPEGQGVTGAKLIGVEIAGGATGPRQIRLVHNRKYLLGPKQVQRGGTTASFNSEAFDTNDFLRSKLNRLKFTYAKIKNMNVDTLWIEKNFDGTHQHVPPITWHRDSDRGSYTLPRAWGDGNMDIVPCLKVMGVKAVGIALKLSVEDSNQFKYFQTWFFTVCVIIFCLLQLNYLNKALDCFNTAVVSPVYYVMFTTLTIVASVIMFKDWDHQTVTQIVTEFCGFITILSGTFLLHKTKDMGGGTKASTVTPDSETTREAPPKSRPEGPEDV